MSTPGSRQHNPKVGSRNGDFLPYFGQKRGRIADGNVMGSAATGCPSRIAGRGQVRAVQNCGADVRRLHVKTGGKTSLVTSAPAYFARRPVQKWTVANPRWCPCNWSGRAHLAGDIAVLVLLEVKNKARFDS